MTANTSNSTIDKPIDWSLCLKLANNKPDIANDLLAMFIEELPSRRVAIQTDLESNNYVTLHEQVHLVHSGACYCGVPQLKAIANELETCFKRKIHDKVPQLIAELDHEIGRILQSYATGDYDG